MAGEPNANFSRKSGNALGPNSGVAVTTDLSECRIIRKGLGSMYVTLPYRKPLIRSSVEIPNGSLAGALNVMGR